MMATCLAAWREGRVGPLDTVRSRHRAWPGDCDPNFHINEGSYLKIAGLSRLALWVRTGVGRLIVREGLRPAAVSSAVTFHREIPPFARFAVASRLVTWDGKYFYFEHRFEHGGRDAARVVVRSVFRDASGPLAAERVMERIGWSEPAPPVPPEFAHWAQMREAGRG
jgi:acyl-CoA thioesterase FadM